LTTTIAAISIGGIVVAIGVIIFAVIFMKNLRSKQSELKAKFILDTQSEPSPFAGHSSIN
jgi:Cu/Ag efflux pump CusA